MYPERDFGRRPIIIGNECHRNDPHRFLCVIGAVGVSLQRSSYNLKITKVSIRFCKVVVAENNFKNAVNDKSGNKSNDRRKNKCLDDF